jgi:hypothetical protein
MARLTVPTRTLLRRLLEWDRERVAGIEASGVDCTVYRARQAAAEVALEAPEERWPAEVRELFQAVLEVTRTPFPLALQRHVGVLRSQPERRPMTPQEIAGHKAAATEIRVIDRLIEVAPAQWI